MNFSVEEENLICMYHTSDRRRTMARMMAALPDMDTEMRQLTKGTKSQEVPHSQTEKAVHPGTAGCRKKGAEQANTATGKVKGIGGVNRAEI